MRLTLCLVVGLLTSAPAAAAEVELNLNYDRSYLSIGNNGIHGRVRLGSPSDPVRGAIVFGDGPRKHEKRRPRYRPGQGLYRQRTGLQGPQPRLPAGYPAPLRLQSVPPRAGGRGVGLTGYQGFGLTRQQRTLIVPPNTVAPVRTDPVDVPTDAPTKQKPAEPDETTSRAPLNPAGVNRFTRARTLPGQAQWQIGLPLPSSMPHVLLNPARYGLEAPPEGQIWVRVRRDVLLIDASDRTVIDKR